MADTLFHYTSTEVLLNIAKHKAIWLTSLTQSNDHLEGKWAWNVLQEMDEDAPWPSIDTLADIMRDTVNAVGLCLSEKDDLLSQWRGYADNAKGVCIEFNVEALEKLIAVFPTMCIRKVSYDRNEQKELLAPVVQSFAHAVDDWAASESRAIRDIRVDAIISLATVLFQVKNPAFREELEWRILLPFPGDQIDKLNFHLSGDQLKPYKPLAFKAEDKLIASVRLAPRNPTPIAVVEGMLAKFQLDVEVNGSVASLR